MLFCPKTAKARTLERQIFKIVMDFRDNLLQFSNTINTKLKFREII